MQKTPARLAPKPSVEPSVEPSESVAANAAANDMVEFGKLANETLDAFVERQWHLLKKRHPGIADVRKIDDGLAKLIGQRARAHLLEGQCEADVWLEVFGQVDNSEFLQGRAAPGKGYDKPMKLSLGWLCMPGHFREVVNGRYSDSDLGRLGQAGEAAAGSFERLRALRERR